MNEKCASHDDFVLDVALDVKTAQELARHETANMTLNVYGRAKEERCRAMVESVGNVVFPGGQSLETADSGHENYTRITQALVDGVDQKAGTLYSVEGSGENNLVLKTGYGYNVLWTPSYICSKSIQL